ncbi:hypothetical protein OIU77_020411 [Salix suchowensis]|uniref:Secreted protein n=1 Tax=Salix suchowensis TaxID=1278906 RepID=A0ABQ9CAD6_9ROSI|nr:hypothetical protein OIU77_020411 [Salix suchowensis]
MKPRACLLLWREPSLAKVIILSTYFLMALARALVVLMRPCLRSWVVRPLRSARRWSGGRLSLGTRLPCLMAKKREPLSTSGKTCPQVILSVETKGEERVKRGERTSKDWLLPLMAARRR